MYFAISRLAASSFAKMLRNSNSEYTLTGITLKPDIPILGFARRMTAYKRPDLLFTDLERLKAIARKQPFQIVLSGKAHPHDENGKHLMEQLCAHARDLAGTITVAFLPEYDIIFAQTLTGGWTRGRIAAAAARGFRHQRDESRIQRRAQFVGAGRLVGRGLHRGLDRMGDRRHGGRAGRQCARAL